MKRVLVVAIATALLMALAIPAFATRGGSGGRGDGPIVYVTGQGLYYDSIVVADPVPANGPFQKLEMAGPTGLQTEFGPGDKGYVAGRWWVDVNGNNERDEGDHFFVCPLLGPGREAP